MISQSTQSDGIGIDLDISNIMRRYTVQVIGAVAFGLELDVFKDKDEQSNLFIRID